MMILTDEDFGLERKIFDHPRYRLGARGIVFNDDGKIAIIYKEVTRAYKLVGGGIEDEAPITAFQREVKEEAGCFILVDAELGLIQEQKSQDNFIQTSYIFVAHVTKNLGIQNFTPKEKEEGSKLLWMSIEDAMDAMKHSEDQLKKSSLDGEMSIYHSKFIVRRDYEILKLYRELCKNEHQCVK